LLPSRNRVSTYDRLPLLRVYFPPPKFGKLRTVSAMQRHQLEHIIRAASGITGATDFVIVGSQAVLGQFPDAPEELLVSIEADVFSLHSQGRAI